MQRASVISLFCEDIREEKSGQDILIGIMPDNIDMRRLPSALPKLGIYIRVNLDVTNQPKSVSAKIQNIDGSETQLQSWDKAVIDKAFADSKSNSMPLVGLILKAVIGPFPVTQAGKLVSKVVIDGDEYIGGVINIIGASATASALPASQSPGAS